MLLLPSARIPFLLLLLHLTLLATPALAQTTTTSSNSTARPSIFPGAGAYAYIGCYNETTNLPSSGGARALAGGTMEGDDALTPQRCLSFCGGSAAQYAGLEYGRECWCAPYLHSLAARLDDAACGLPCAGDAAAACGGALRLSLYNRTAAAGSGGGAKTGAAAAAGRGDGWGLVVGVAVGAAAVVGGL